jgi:hypothetical protein
MTRVDLHASRPRPDLDERPESEPPRSGISKRQPAPIPAAPSSAGVRQLVERYSSPQLPTTRLANQREAQVLAHPAVQHLPAEARADLRAILATLRQGPEAMRIHHLEKLQLLFDTPFAGDPNGTAPTALERDVHADVDASLTRHARQLKAGTIDPRREERLSGAERTWTERRGRDGTTFLVDRTRMDAIVVKVKVKLGEVSCEAMKVKIVALEDAIEKEASTRGYTVDLVFSKRSGPDVFEVDVDDRQWADELNWAGGADVLAHELHHALGLDDRYDRIESHADNPHMPMAERLYWFREELRKGVDTRAEFSQMDDHTRPVLAEDICAVVGGNRKACLAARLPLDPPNLPPLDPGFSPHR